MSEWIKNNLIPVVGAAGLVLAFLLTVYVKQEIATQLANAGIVPQSDVTALDTRVGNLEEKHDDDVAENSEDIDTIETRWNAFIDEIAAQRIED